MSDDDQNDPGEFNEEGPGVNSDLASWLYVIGGVPMMIVFFVGLFLLVGSCDVQNTMIPA